MGRGTGYEHGEEGGVTGVLIFWLAYAGALFMVRPTTTPPLEIVVVTVVCAVISVCILRRAWKQGRPW